MSLKDFQILQKIGEGAYSSVYKVRRIVDNQEYALKKVKLNELTDKEKQNALNEVRILASIRSPHIICYKEVFMTENSNYLCIIMEYTNNGDLYQKIVEHQKKGAYIKEDEIWSIFIQLVEGLKALHDTKVYHRDVKVYYNLLKSANVFLQKDGSIRLGDMNVSKIAKQGLLYTQTGTPYYASPEVWKDQPYDNKSDIWSLGCVLYEITTLKPPFRAEDMEGLYKKVIRGFYPKIPSQYSQDLSNTIRALLQVNPKLRPNCEQILNFPNTAKRMDDSHFLQVDENNIDMLQTIKIPKNLIQLNENLPKANYSPIKTIQLDRKNFFRTIGGSVDLQSDNKEQYSKKLPSLSTQKNKQSLDQILQNDNYSQQSKGLHKKNQDQDKSLIKSKPKMEQTKPKKIEDIQQIYGGQLKRDLNDSLIIKSNNSNKLPKLKLSKDQQILPKIIPSILKQQPNLNVANSQIKLESLESQRNRKKINVDLQQDLKSVRKSSKKKKLNSIIQKDKLDYILNLK